MQLKHLIKPLEQMSDEELQERLREVRHNRTVIRPAAKKRTERTEKKASRGRVSAASKLLDGLSEEERLKLIEELSKGEPSA